MKYVKLTAKHDTWFKEGTEVYDYYCKPPDQLQRVTLEEWEGCISFEGIKALCVIGRRTSKLKNELQIFGEGERWDGEYCGCDEFDVEIVDEPF